MLIKACQYYYRIPNEVAHVNQSLIHVFDLGGNWSAHRKLLKHRVETEIKLLSLEV